MNTCTHLLTRSRLRTAILREGEFEEVQRDVAAAAGRGPPDAPVSAPEEAPRPVPAVVLVITGRADVVKLWHCRVTPEGRRRKTI